MWIVIGRRLRLLAALLPFVFGVMGIDAATQTASSPTQRAGTLESAATRRTGADG